MCATPVFADVDPDTLNLTPGTIAEVVKMLATRAVILVHQAGTPADVDAIRALCDPLSIVVIEDAACAVGSTYRGNPVGSGSSLAAFHLRSANSLPQVRAAWWYRRTAAQAALLRRMREHGRSVGVADVRSSGVTFEEYLEVGFNYRMTDIQAAVALVQLGRLPALVARRRGLARRYHDGLAGIRGIDVV